jgi:NAD(P)-dependent dehydrogenase (short-subunit alcohol dehydrogenase family)
MQAVAPSLKGSLLLGPHAAHPWHRTHVLHLPPAALRMTDLNFSKVNYDPLKAYKGSKMALALFAKELAARTAGSNITVYAADPGNTGGCKAGLWYDR